MAEGHHSIIPAKAGIQTAAVAVSESAWIPAFAGMTIGGGK
jgi:hypothetical protein